MFQTILDAYQHYTELCGETPVRTRDEVQGYIQTRGLRYEELDQTFWGEMFDSGWALGQDAPEPEYRRVNVVLDTDTLTDLETLGKRLRLRDRSATIRYAVRYTARRGRV